MDEVCKQLDDTVLQMFQVLEDIYDKQDKLEQAMKDGFLAMSRARYLMGVKWVSADQILNADFTAKYRTLTDSSLADEASTLDIVESSLKTSDIENLRLLELLQDTTDTDCDKKIKLTDIEKTDSDKQTSLRKRRTDNEGSEVIKTEKEIEKTKKPEEKTSISKNSQKHDDDGDDASASKKESSSNSLSLFGILTPHTLRTSQKHFEDGVNIGVSLADLKLKLGVLQCRYQRLSKQKLSLLSVEQ